MEIAGELQWALSVVEMVFLNRFCRPWKFITIPSSFGLYYIRGVLPFGPGL